MVKLIMVSKAELVFDESVMNGEDLDLMEAIKNGDIKIGLPKVTLEDEDGNKLLDLEIDREESERLMGIILEEA